MAGHLKLLKLLMCCTIMIWTTKSVNGHRLESSFPPSKNISQPPNTQWLTKEDPSDDQSVPLIFPGQQLELTSPVHGVVPSRVRRQYGGNRSCSSIRRRQDCSRPCYWDRQARYCSSYDVAYTSTTNRYYKY